MGIFRRAPLDTQAIAEQAAAKAVDAILDKMSVPGLGRLPAGTVATPAATTVEQLAAQLQSFGNTNFGPGMPLQPRGLDPRDPATGQPSPRISEFPVGVNLNLQGNRHVPFTVLRATADSVDVIRACIRTRVAHLLALEWDITLSKTAVKRVMADEGITSPGKAWQVARTRYEPEAVRLREWWEKPDKFNGFNFADWLSQLLEEQLVIDAATIWPRRNLKGDVISFEVIDGATIKPLLDYRGSTPIPPSPAFQQVLYGFPRGEWQASTGETTQYAATELVYRPRYRRSFSPYGFSEVEQALSAVDLYLKRIGWIRGEFTDGATPDTWMKSDIAIGNGAASLNPDQLAAYEAALNGELAGQDAERRAIKLLPRGMAPEQMANFAQKYHPDLDEFLIKLVTMCFSVMPTEIGFPPKSGIGGKGHQEGEANSAFRKEIRPSVQWMQNLLTDLSRTYLGMPAELEFSFLGYEVEDQDAAEKVMDSQTRRGGITINESRAAAGAPLLDFEEADEPFVVTGSGLVFLRGAMAAQAAAATTSAEPVVEQPTVAAVEPTSATDPRPVDEPTSTVPAGHVAVAAHTRRVGTRAAASDEAQKFAVFARKKIADGKWRPFDFEHLPPPLADELNDLGASGDLVAIKALVADLGKASARSKPGRVTRTTRQHLIAAHSKKLADTARQLLPSAAELIAEWDRRQQATKAPAPTSEVQRHARAFVREQLADTAPMGDTVDDMLTDGYTAGLDALDVDPDEVADGGRFRDLLAGGAVIAAGFIADLVANVGDGLTSDQPADTIDTALDPSAWETAASNELTAPITAGVQDGSKTVGVEYVRLIASDGDCTFCAEYDNRIMPVDHDSGMPPLHSGCVCDIEPLEPSTEEPQ